MCKPSLYFLLFAIVDCLHVCAQEQPALHTPKQDMIRIIKDTVPQWVRNIKLLPNE